jgi:hypothetical protein
MRRAAWVLFAVLGMAMNASAEKAGKQPAAAAAMPLQVCVGGLDRARVSELTTCVLESREALPRYASAGATSHEAYVRWSMIEPERGRFDYSYFDELLKLHKEAGIRWVPFLIAGPAYTLPQWFIGSPDDSGYVCLEHRERSMIQSLWNPRLRPHIQRVLRDFGKHYDGNPQVESVLLGITGNYGESIYPASGLDWTQDLNGPYHTHGGWWAADPDAIKSFQEYARKHYATIDALNKDWQTTVSSFAALEPALPKDRQSTTARMHLTRWYQESMNEWADFWMREAHGAMPRTDVYLVVGGHAADYLGLDISAQTKLAAARGCGIRMTNEGDDYGQNFACTRMVASACRLYGTFFSYEPAGTVTEVGVAGRVFNSAASGARCLHWYDGNLWTSPPTLAKWNKYRKFAIQGQPVIDVAVFYPRQWMNVRGDDHLGPMYADFAALRNATDYDYLDEQMIGELMKRKDNPFRYLIVRRDFADEKPAARLLEKLASWKGGPKLLHFDRGEVTGPTSATVLRRISETVHPNDGFAPGVYFTRFKDGRILFLNHSAQEVDLSKTHPRMVSQPTVVESYGLAQVSGGQR